MVKKLVPSPLASPLQSPQCQYSSLEPSEHEAWFLPHPVRSCGGEHRIVHAYRSRVRRGIDVASVAGRDSDLKRLMEPITHRHAHDRMLEELEDALASSMQALETEAAEAQSAFNAHVSTPNNPAESKNVAATALTQGMSLPLPLSLANGEH